MEEYDYGVPVVAVQCAPGNRLDFSWGQGAELRFIELRPPSDNPREDDEDDSTCQTNVIWTECDAAQKEVALSMSAMTLKLAHSLQTSGDPPEDPSQEEYAYQFRRELLKDRPRVFPDAVRSNILLYDAVVWGLLEIIFVTGPRQDSSLAEDMTAWLAEHSSSIEKASGVSPSLQERLDTLLSVSRPELSEDYWPCMTSLFCQGRIRDVFSLLEAHDTWQLASRPDAVLPAQLKEQHELLDAFFCLARTMPRYQCGYTPVHTPAPTDSTGHCHDNLQDLVNYRERWVGQCQLYVDTNAELMAAVEQTSPSTVEGLRKLMAIASGDENAITAACNTWVEWAVAYLLFVHPDLQWWANCWAGHPGHRTPGELLAALKTGARMARRTPGTLHAHGSSLVSMATQHIPINEDQTLLFVLKEIIEYAAAGEIQLLVNAISQSNSGTPFFLVHVHDLIRSSGRGIQGPLSRQLDNFGGTEVEYFRILLADSLIPPSAQAAVAPWWRLALTYMQQCAVNGKAAAESLLEALPVGTANSDSLRLWSKASAAARSLGLPNAAASLARAAGARAWYAGDIATAVAVLSASGAGEDWVRVAQAMQPVEDVTLYQLSDASADYRVALASTPLDYDLKHLSLSAGDSGTATGNNWLQGFYKMQEAMQKMQHCLRPSLADPTQPDPSPQSAHTMTPQAAANLKEAAKGLLDSIVTLLYGSNAIGAGAREARLQQPAVPAAALLPLLARLIPALEIPAVAAVCDKDQLAAISAAAAWAAERAALGAAGAGAADGAVQPNVARLVADVQLCVARLATHSLIYGAA